MLRFIVLVLALAAYSRATIVRQCDPDNKIADLNNRVDLLNCTKPPCRLIKDTFMKITLKFKPDKDYTGLKNQVTAEILGARLPFVGVDGENACGNVFNADGSKLEKCHMKAGQEYVYKNSFEILRIYPTLKTVVHWALVTSQGKEVICFEVPVRITN